MNGIETEPSLFASLWRFKWRVAAAAVLAAAIGYGLSTLQPTLYQATGQALLNDPRSSGGAAADLGLYIDPGRYVRNQVEVFESPQVATRASEILEGAISPLAIQDATSATASTDIDAVIVQGTQPTAGRSVDLVNALVQAYVDVVEEDISSAVDSTITTLEQSKADINVTIAEMDALLTIDPDNAGAEAQRNAALAQLVTINTRIEQLSTNAALYGSGIQLYVPPATPTAPIQPKPIRNAAIAAVLGLIAAGAWAWWRAESDQRADDRNAPAAILDAPLLAVIPESSDVGAQGPNPAGANPKSGATEAYHFAVSSLSFALEQVSGRTVVITSADPGEGKSVTALNIAFAAAKDGRRTILIDADERARGLTRLSGLGIGLGVTDMANGRSAEDVTGDWQTLDDTSLPFVPAGSRLDESAAAFFRSSAFQNALPRLTDGYDMAIIDTPPLMSASEATDIAAQADGVILVVRHGTPLNNLHDARQHLSISRTPILGYIFNRARGSTGAYSYGYGKDPN